MASACCQGALSQQHRQHWQLDNNQRIFLVKCYVFSTAFLTATAMLCFETTALLYTNHADFTSPSNTVFFVRLMSLGLIIPLIASPLLGYCSSRFGPRLTMCCGYTIIMIGFAALALSKSSPFAFVAGYTMYGIISSIRIIRFSLIGDFIPPKERTSAMAIHQFMSLLGFLAAPLIWLSVQGRHLILISSVFELDQFAINLLCCITLTAINLTLSFTILGCVNTPTNDAIDPLSGANNQLLTSGTVAVQSNQTMQYGGTDEASIEVAVGNPDIDLKSYRNLRIIYFTAIILLTRLSLYIYLSIFQPIMIGYFKFNEHDMGITYVVIGTLSLLPPLVITLLTHVLPDRQILLTGLVIKIIGAAMFLPLFGPVKSWQPVLGYILVVKASVFCTTSAISLFTKLLGPLCSSKTIGNLWGMSSISPAVIQIIFSSEIVAMFSTWRFSAFVLPTCLALFIVALPSGWRILNESSPVTKYVLRYLHHNKNGAQSIKS